MSIKYHYKKYNVIFISIFICSISFIIFSCKKSGENSELEVANGNVIYENEYPGAVRLVFNKTQTKRASCTGSIISSNTILTAAHCTDALPVGGERVVVINGKKVGVWKATFNSRFNQNLPEETPIEQEIENLKKDIAIWVFPDRMFENYPGKLQISDIGFNTLTDDSIVRYVGWGCYTKLQVALEKNGQKKTAEYGNKKYDIYEISCDESRKSVKRTGVNTINHKFDYMAEDQSYMKIRSSRDGVDEKDGKLTTDQVVTTSGDSGGPLLIADQNIKILGVASYSSGNIYEPEFCNRYLDDITDSKAKLDKTYAQKLAEWMDICMIGCGFINPVSSYNMNFLQDAVDTHGAIIPGIQVGVGVIEYNGKIKVIYKDTDTAFNKNVVEHKVIEKFNNKPYSTVDSLKQSWRNTNFSQRSKASWSFE